MLDIKSNICYYSILIFKKRNRWDIGRLAGRQVKTIGGVTYGQARSVGKRVSFFKSNF